MYSSKFVRVVAALIGALVGPVSVAGQTGTSAISGFVKDGTGAALPGASVKVINVETGVTIDLVTNEEGVYRASALLPGQYRIETSLDGFETSVRGPITLHISETIAVDFTLGIGRQQESVTVTGVAPLVESQSSTVAQIVRRSRLAALPLPNRAASSLAGLAPGVVMVDAGTGTAENYPVFSVAGGRSRNQVFLLDGGNATNAVGLTRPQQLTSLPVDAMQEFRVITNNYGAEYGNSTGGVVAMSTRSGTNTFHGSIFESFRNDALDAKNYFATSKPPINLNQFGGTLGGPLIAERTFFFGTWERTRQLVSNAVVSTVPTLRNRE